MSRNGFRSRRWLVGLVAGLMLVVAVGVGGVHRFLHIPTLPLPESVSLRTVKVRLTDKVVAVDCYLPTEALTAPVVVVAHGFSRNRQTMAGWGGLLAADGFIAVVPNLPAWADHPRNGHALAELLAAVTAEKLFQQPKPMGRAALVGFSAGGASSLLAAAGNPNVAGWVGLDPVGLGREVGQAAKTLDIPCFALRAEPAPWNASGNARQIFAALPGPALSLVVNGATHVDAEHPTSRAAEWACGRTDPARRAVFGRYLLASLRAALLGDELAFQQLATATNDLAVHEVEFRRPEAFRLSH